MDKVRFGIIGAGNMGAGHFKNFLNGAVKNGICTAIADIDSTKIENLKKFAQEQHPEEEKNVNYYNSGDELINAKTCDVVVIAVPHYDHPVFAIKALQNGYHAIVEKPAGVYALQVEEMLEEAKKHPQLKLGIMFNQRTNPAFKKMKQLIQNGELGEIKRLNWIITDWFRGQRYYDSGGWRATWAGEGGGVLYNQAPHNIDLFQWIPDMMPNKVRAFCHFGKWHDIEVEDDVTAYFEYPNGATGVFVTTTADAPGTNRFEVTGDKGRLIYDKGRLTFTKLEEPISEFLKNDESGFAMPKFNDVELQIEAENPQHVGIFNNFANAVLGLEELYAKAIDGIKGVTLANAMHLSSWLNETVEIPLDNQKFYELLQEKIKNSTKIKKVTESISVDLSNTFNN